MARRRWPPIDGPEVGRHDAQDHEGQDRLRHWEIGAITQGGEGLGRLRIRGPGMIRGR
jgi:hypothetical protein